MKCELWCSSEADDYVTVQYRAGRKAHGLMHNLGYVALHICDDCRAKLQEKRKAQK